MHGDNQCYMYAANAYTLKYLFVRYLRLHVIDDLKSP